MAKSDTQIAVAFFKRLSPKQQDELLAVMREAVKRQEAKKKQREKTTER